MIPGEVVRTATLASVKGRTVRLAVVDPGKDTQTIGLLRKAAEAWDVAGDRIEAAGDLDNAVRAWFASDTAFKAAEWLMGGLCCVLVALDADTGALLGATLYTATAGDYWIHQFAVAPDNQPGAINRDQIRGIGSTMLGAIAARVAADPGCVRVQLYALDDAAERFWRARGFHDGVQPLHMTCPETARLAAMVAAAGVDRPDAGEAAEAEDWELIAHTSPPRIRSRILAWKEGRVKTPR